jgi:hypothetical protein
MPWPLWVPYEADLPLICKVARKTGVFRKL